MGPSNMLKLAENCARYDPEGKWWREVLPVGRAVGSTLIIHVEERQLERWLYTDSWALWVDGRSGTRKEQDWASVGMSYMEAPVRMSTHGMDLWVSFQCIPKNNCRSVYQLTWTRMIHPGDANQPLLAPSALAMGHWAEWPSKQEPKLYMEPAWAPPHQGLGSYFYCRRQLTTRSDQCRLIILEPFHSGKGNDLALLVLTSIPDVELPCLSPVPLPSVAYRTPDLLALYPA